MIELKGMWLRTNERKPSEKTDIKWITDIVAEMRS